MNLISTAVAALSPSLATPRALAEYARAQATHPALAPCSTPSAVLSALAESSALPLEQKDAIVLALITEHQRSRHHLWQALLLTAYAPMLYGVAKRTFRVSREDAAQGALLAFLEAIAKVRVTPAPAILSRALRYATERAAFGQVCLEEEPQAEAISRREPDPRSLVDTLEQNDRLRGIVRELTRLFGSEADAREILDVLLHARRNTGPLVEYVDATYPELTRAKRDRIFSRLSRMRAEALRHITTVFGGALERELESAAA